MTSDVMAALHELEQIGAVEPGTPPERVVDLVVAHARSLDDLDAFTALETLSLVGCAVGDYAAVARLPVLRVLVVECSDLVDVAWLTRLAPQVLVLRRNRIRDATPVVGLEGLQVLDLTGNPLDAPSRDAARARRGPLVSLDDDELAAANAALADAGVPVVGYRSGAGVRACATGLDLTDHPDAAHADATVDDLLALARGEVDARELLGLREDRPQEDQ